MHVTIKKTLRLDDELSESDFNYFINLFEFNISTLYPFSSTLTAKSIVEIHKKRLDTNGYFTKRKTIWKLIDENNVILGFSVVTEKRGGSVKFGPSIVVKDHRNKGYGSFLREELERIYLAKGYRKSYLTTNASNKAAFTYLLNIGYKIELHLRKHYTVQEDEIVLSKFLRDQSCTYLKPKISKEIIDNFGVNVVSYLNEYYEEIDETFYKNLQKSLSSEFDKTEESFINKTKIKFDFRQEDFFAIASPKRGGCIKISPLVMSGHTANDIKNIKQILSFFDDSYHKFYTFVPINRVEDRRTLEQCGFIIEGVFMAPYKIGVDMFIVSFFKPVDSETK